MTSLPERQRPMLVPVPLAAALVALLIVVAAVGAVLGEGLLGGE